MGGLPPFSIRNKGEFMKRFVFILSLLLAFMTAGLVRADDVEYSIEAYKGHLQLRNDGQATFTQEITYDFDTSYNGQYVTLGAADPVPQGFTILDNPQVTATVNGKTRDVRVEEEKLSDGRKLKVFNPGDSGDRVVLTVTWQIHQILSYYSDIAELNWFPISDWDGAINNLDFTLEGLDASQGQLFVHRGFFNEEVTVRRVDNAYQFHVDRIPSGGKLELHAYWPMTESLTQANSDYLIKEKHKQAFLTKEHQIQSKHKLYRGLLFVAVPVLVFGLLLVSGLLILAFFRSTRAPGLIKDARLYEVPQDLAPLVLAKNVYKQNFDKTGLDLESGSLSFNHMVEATILDLIDRGNLRYDANADQPTLAIVHYDGLDDFEVTFLGMLFDQTTVVDESQMFAKYQLDEKALEKAFDKANTEKERNRLRAVGKRVRRLFKEDAGQLSKEVGRKEKKLGLPSHFRDLTKRERSLQFWSSFTFILAIFLLGGSFLFLLLGFDAFSLGLPFLLAALPLAAIGFCVNLSVTKRRNYCLDPNNIESYIQWRSFENMIKTIESFKQTELEAITIWNRILVYATLYGQAKRVSKVLKKYQIHLSDVTLDDYIYSPAHFILLHNASNLGHYVTASENVSHFSTDSNSGSGGFSGGGFSGGGGGGGGGAF